MERHFNPELDGHGAVQPLRRAPTKIPAAPPNPALAEALLRAIERKKTETAS